MRTHTSYVEYGTSGLILNVEEVLNKFKDGELNLEEAQAAISQGLAENLYHTVVDHDRERRTGAGEVIFGEGKTPEQISDIVTAMEPTMVRNCSVSEYATGWFTASESTGLPLIWRCCWFGWPIWLLIPPGASPATPECAIALPGPQEFRAEAHCWRIFPGDGAFP